MVQGRYNYMDHPGSVLVEIRREVGDILGKYK